MTTKTNPTINLNPTSWEEIDQLGRRLVELEVKKNDIEGNYNLSISSIKEQQASTLAPITNERKAIEGAIEAFCEAHKADFAKKRSRELNFVTVGYRIAKSVSLPRVKEKLTALLRAIKSHGYGDTCIAFEEKPDKEALAELPDEALVKLGIKRVIKDSFRIEPRLESLEVDKDRV